MKQHITIEQLLELSEEHRNYFNIWMLSKGYNTTDEYGIFSIGQMIEFLDTLNFSAGFNMGRMQWHFHCFPTSPDPKLSLVDGIDTYGIELCDALWEAVKEVLNKDNNT